MEKLHIEAGCGTRGGRDADGSGGQTQDAGAGLTEPDGTAHCHGPSVPQKPPNVRPRALVQKTGPSAAPDAGQCTTALPRRGPSVTRYCRIAAGLFRTRRIARGTRGVSPPVRVFLAQGQEDGDAHDSPNRTTPPIRGISCPQHAHEPRRHKRRPPYTRISQAPTQPAPKNSQLEAAVVVAQLPVGYGL